MTRDEAKKLLPILQAFAEGKTIEYGCIGGWKPISSMDIVGDLDPDNYRIKPEPKYRPFASGEECWAEMLKHQPFAWLRKICEENNEEGLWYEHIQTVLDGSLWLSLDEDLWTVFNFVCAMDEYTFADGTPFGVKVEED